MEEIDIHPIMTFSNNVSIKKKNECSGCALCANICPAQAIVMQPDTLGFKYPVVDYDKCTNCGLCLKKCSFFKPQHNEIFKQRYYALRHNDESELLKSQSGAAFIVLSDVILEKGGSIYGAALNDTFHVFHKRVTDKEERESLRYSKYTQSDIEHCYNLIRRDLENGLYVLFSGTPCQVAAVKAAIPKRLSDKLFLIDLICHGVPAPKIWNDYIDYIENKYGKIQRAYFRDKRYGWNVQKETFYCHKEHSFITFKILFHSRICLRHSCYNCHFADYDRCSDLTIGDFWGWEKISDKYNDNKGISLVLVNTLHGAELLGHISEECFLQEVQKSECEQPNLIAPSVSHIKREDFETDYSKRGFLYVAKQYSDLNIKSQFRYFLRRTKRSLINTFKKLDGE